MFSWIVVFKRDFCEAIDLSKQKKLKIETRFMDVLFSKVRGPAGCVPVLSNVFRLLACLLVTVGIVVTPAHLKLRAILHWSHLHFQNLQLLQLVIGFPEKN